MDFKDFYRAVSRIKHTSKNENLYLPKVSLFFVLRHYYSFSIWFPLSPNQGVYASVGDALPMEIQILNAFRKMNRFYYAVIRKVQFSLFKGYTNADLKIFPYIQILIKIIPWKFRILNLRILELFTRKVCIFLKK